MSRRTVPASERIAAWAAAGEDVAFRGRRIHAFHRPGERPALLLLHGFPSSSFDWRGLLAALPGQEVIAFDALGFGLSDKPRDHVYTLGWQADLAEALVERAGSPPVVLVAHDMGTSVATELLARDLRGETPLDVRGALLFNGSVILERASLTLGQRALRSPAGPLVAGLTNERAFRRQFGALFSREHPLSDAEAADQFALIRIHGGRRVMHRLVHYLDERVRLADRWHGAVRDWPGPLHLAWGLQDPVATEAVLDGLRELRPHAPVTTWDDVGHYPAVEAPERVAAAVRALLADAPGR
ncbi:MAG: alpha/beta hydrolase [Solirubrobacteraceae bacterium]|jgi:pimeloyl-ACP methyl ester carboxylesterase|nr:alpha/beta hydrolase [Solirubrobacteraceae bacterium]